jgi:hypothetical protein
MANGQQIAQQNFDAFLVWMASKNDDDYRSLENRGVLSRTDIAKECGFAKSSLDQNPRIKTALKALEATLRERGVLPPPASNAAPAQTVVREPGKQRAAMDTERLRRLEQENASMRAELSELKRLLEQYTMVRDALAQGGRVPR